jgi:3-methylcrotonyl-CoA carboxylase beta subunit
VEEDKRKRGKSEWPAADKEAFIARIKGRYDAEGEPSFASARLWDDGVIDPADTRRVVGLSLAAALNAGTGSSSYGIFRM